MRVRLFTRSAGPDGNYAPGIHEVGDSLGQQWIAAGCAEGLAPQGSDPEPASQAEAPPVTDEPASQPETPPAPPLAPPPAAPKEESRPKGKKKSKE